MADTFSARVIMLISIMVQIFITLKSLLHKLGVQHPYAGQKIFNMFVQSFVLNAA